MNIYARYFDQEILAHTADELIDFLSTIEDINITQELINDINHYLVSDNFYPERYKVRPRVYFILIKTAAETMGEFKSSPRPAAPRFGNDVQSQKEYRNEQLNEIKPGWYRASIVFKRVIQEPATGKFRYQDTEFSILTLSESGVDCYNKMIQHLKGRQDVDPRSQFPSAKGNNFKFTFIKAAD